MRAGFFALVVLLASGAEAQRIRLSGPTTSSGGGGGTLDPARADTAASYTATGPNGVRTTPQASPAALGACAALAGAWGAATPVGEFAPTGYFCNGVRWARVWTDEDGVTAHPNRALPAAGFVAQAPSGAYGFKANNRPVWDFGDGIDDEVVSEGSQLLFRGSVKIRAGQSFSVDQISPSGLTNDLVLFPLVSSARWVRLWPLGDTACVSGSSGGIQTRSSDGNRLWQCDGTNAYRVSRVVTAAVVYDFPSIPNGSCTTADVTVPGAATGDTVSVNADFALPAPVGIGNARTTATDTVTLRLCNHDPTNSQDPASGTFRFRIER